MYFNITKRKAGYGNFKKRINLRTILLLYFFAMSPLITISQPVDLGTWNLLNVKYNHSAELSLFGEGQLRSLSFFDQFHYYEIKGGFNYLIHKSVLLTLGAGSYQTYREGGNLQTPKNNNEFRLWPQILLLQQINNFKIDQRYRSEMRWTSKGYRNRFRYRAGVSLPFGNENNGYKPFQVSLSNELFFTDNEPYFERNRIQLALNYKLSKSSTIQLGYLHQFDYKINDETGRDFLVVGYYFELFRNSESKSESENQLLEN
ncbi:MAG: DUF2490 domain-containing protein [Bacteroidetes bacterium]|nr:DUF2490 domain-containing protein [Bacteroidota bacterium]